MWPYRIPPVSSCGQSRRAVSHLFTATVKNSYSQGSLFSSAKSRWRIWRKRDLLFLLHKMIYAQTFIRKLFPSCKDHFPWLHLTTGTILSIGSLIQSDWIHCSAIQMDVLWSFLSLNSHLNPLFNLRAEFPPKNAAPLSSESWINQLSMPFVGSVHLNEIIVTSLHQTIHNDSSSNLNLHRPLYILTTTGDVFSLRS